MDLNSLVGARIKELRETKGITQMEMGRRLGHTDVYISQIETGKRRIGLDLLEKIADCLDTSPFSFFHESRHEDDDTEQMVLLVRRMDQVRSSVSDLDRNVRQLTEVRKAAADPDSITAGILSLVHSMDAPMRVLLLEIAQAIRANPSMIPTPQSDGLAKAS